MIAHRRPSLPGAGVKALSTLTDSYLRLFCAGGDDPRPPDGVGSQGQAGLPRFPAITCHHRVNNNKGLQVAALVSVVSSGCSFMTSTGWI